MWSHSKIQTQTPNCHFILSLISHIVIRHLNLHIKFHMQSLTHLENTFYAPVAIDKLQPHEKNRKCIRTEA